MIKINLTVKRAPRFAWRRVALLAGAGGALLGLLVGSLTWWSRYQTLGQELANLGLLEQEYRRVIERSGAVARQEEAVQRQTLVLALLSRNQAPVGQSAVLGRILGAAGAGVTISQITVSREGEAAIHGEAASFQAAMQYLGALRGITGLSAVEERRLTTEAGGRTSFLFAGRVQGGGKP